MLNANPMQLINMIKSGQNPQQLLMSILQDQAGSNPMSKNLLELAQKGDQAQLEKIARNMVESRGGNFDEEFKAFKQQFGFK